MGQGNLTLDLLEYAQSAPTSPALLLPEREISYHQLNDLVWRLAQHLHDRGVRAGHVVGLTFADELALVVTLLAVTRLGATVFSIPPGSTQVQRLEMAAQARVTVLTTDRPTRFDAGVPFLQIDRSILSGLPRRVSPGILADSPAAPFLLITGSGSTGKSKLIPVTHAQASARVGMIAAFLQVTALDRVASLSTFDFSTSKFRLYVALSVGASYCLQVWDAANPVVSCLKRDITVMQLTVFHAEKILQDVPPEARSVLGAIRVFEINSSAVSDDLRERIKRFLSPNLYVRYGTNEVGPVCMAGPPEVFAVSGTVGRRLGGVQLQVVNQSLQPVPAGTIGLVRIRSPGQVNGYPDNEEATRQSFQDGWFMPNDLGKLGHDGQLVYYGRADHMMIMNGMNIFPAEIEQVLTGHADVRDAAAVPVRHKVHQDIPICAVALHPGADVTEQALLSYARERLGAHGPQRVLIFDQIPRNHDGKLIRAELNDLIVAVFRPAP